MDNIIKVGIWGLGLIGASILKGLSKSDKFELYCCSSSSYKKALAYTKHSSDDPQILKEADIVFVCSNASDTLSYLNKLNGILNPNTVVADVCSIKKELLNKSFNYNFILSHPMAGSEKSGFDAGCEDLFKEARWLVEKENDILEEIIVFLGANSLKIDMTRHDELCALISHLPTILSYLIFNNATDEAKLIASSGFRDMTRLSVTNSNLALSMFKDNEENITNAFNNLIKEFESLKKLSDDEKIKLFEETAQKRVKMYNEAGKNIIFKI